MTATHPDPLAPADLERLRAACGRYGADPDVALWVVRRAVQEFPDPHGPPRVIGGGSFERVSYGRSLAARTQHGWSVGLEAAVVEFLKGDGS